MQLIHDLALRLAAFLAAFFLTARAWLGFVVRKVRTTFWKSGSLVGSDFTIIGVTMPNFGIPNIDPELAEPLGQIVVRWSSVEYLISMLLGTLVFADLAGIQVVTTNIAVSAQTKWIRALMSVNQPQDDLKTRVEELLTRVDDLRSERNEFVHGHWDTTNCHPKTALIQTINLERNEVIRERLVTKQDLSDLVTDIEAWIKDYVALGRELGFPRHKDHTKSIFAD